MKNVLIAAATLATALPAFAMDEASTADTNGDGMLSVEEVMAVYPEVSTDNFMEADTDGDGLLSVEEVAAAQEAGLIPASDQG
ncbi:MAG: EF-hand domain-containing protein [Paracoccaceae bacterium]|nr:EF-hand domain-containing protein [Paracoccaceae bacterium]